MFYYFRNIGSFAPTNKRNSTHLLTNYSFRFGIMDKKRVYTFGNGQAEGNAKMREQLGGKGANLAEMNLIGVPVPPGFTITTDVCNEYYEIGKDKVVALLKD